MYFDVCCLNRPFDDQAQERIHLEAEAVLAIITPIRSRGWDWVSSEVVDFEIDQTPDAEKRWRVHRLADGATRSVTLTMAIRERAEHLVALGFQSLDALHLACTEAGGVEVLLSTDRAFVGAASRAGNAVTVRVVNPLRWIEETTDR
ncbi:MAG: PIN domain-containing protein [Chloroflexi bacterium]|nr:PIN domain-containing protein [Chloroflexota bacterium]